MEIENYRENFDKWWHSVKGNRHRVDVTTNPMSINVVWHTINYDDDFEKNLQHFFDTRCNGKCCEVYYEFRPDKLHIW